MSNKTPYEIRLDLITMAKDHYDQMLRAQVEIAKLAMNVALADPSTTRDAVMNWANFVPNPYDISDVVKKAEELNEFINKKD